MIKISSVVEEILLSSDIALAAMEEGILNLSAFAEHIREDVEKRTMKPVQKGTIVIALSRLQKKFHTSKQILRKVHINHVAIKSNLVEIVYENSAQNQLVMSKLDRQIGLNSGDFFTVTQGLKEINFILEQKNQNKIQKYFGNTVPLKEVSQLAAITLTLAADYFHESNIIFSLLHPFAVRKIPIGEIVSTSSEITLILEEQYLQQAFMLFKKFL